jgi:membrane protein DedA with SNARE-associated domain
MILQLLNWLKEIAASWPLELFVVIGSVLEEIIAPIPAPLVMSLAGYIASERGHGWVYFALLALIGAFGKTLASYALYVLGDKAEDVVVNRWGKLLGLERQKLDHATALMNKGWWDKALLVFLRAVPLIPTFIVSIACGVLKVPMRTFLWTTVAGSFVRNVAMIWLGVAGTEYVQQFWEDGGAEMAGKPLVMVSALIGLIIGCGIALLIKRKLGQVASVSEIKEPESS